MIHLRDADSIYLDKGLVGFTKQLVSDGVVERQVDLLLVGAAYAIREKLPPLETIRRHELIRVASLDPDVRLVLEASLAWYSREARISQPESPKQVLELLARMGSAGISKFRNDWEGSSPGQVRLRLLALAGHTSPSQSPVR